MFKNKMLKKKLNKETKVTIISKGMIVDGTLSTDEVLEIHGVVNAEKGNPAIRGSSYVRIAGEARVTGDIHCHDLVVEGFVDGSVFADGSVKLLRGAVVLGSIESGSLIMQDGVSFNGSVKMKPALSNAVVTDSLEERIPSLAESGV